MHVTMTRTQMIQLTCCHRRAKCCHRRKFTPSMLSHRFLVRKERFAALKFFEIMPYFRVNEQQRQAAEAGAAHPRRSFSLNSRVIPRSVSLCLFYKLHIYSSCRTQRCISKGCGLHLSRGVRYLEPRYGDPKRRWDSLHTCTTGDDRMQSDVFHQNLVQSGLRGE